MSATGLNVTNFAVQYVGASFAKIAASDHDLIILEAKPGGPGSPDLTDAQIAQLVAQGRVVSGYVSVGQTDDARPYWDPSWTVDGTDTGAPTSQAPAWLAEQADSFAAAMVEFWNPDWKALVIDQVTDMASRGYTAVFLDNILTYYELADIRGELGTPQSQFYAAEMMAFVGEIKAAGQAINPDFAVIANGGPYIIGDAAAFGTTAVADYLDAVDAIMAESFFGLINGARDEHTLDVFETLWAANGIDVLALEYSTDPAQIDAFVAEAATRGFAPSVSGSQDLNSLPEALVDTGTGDGVTVLGTIGSDVMTGDNGPDTMNGQDGNDLIRVFGGDDTAFGESGRDRLFGGDGNDSLYGGEDGDRMTGGNDADQMFGGAGNDAMLGQDGNDMLSGDAGNDRLIGGAGDDILSGGDGNDIYVGGEGSDTFVFEDQGRDRLIDFDLALDVLAIDLSQSYSAANVGGGLRIAYSASDMIILRGLDTDDLPNLTIVDSALL